MNRLDWTPSRSRHPHKCDSTPKYDRATEERLKLYRDIEERHRRLMEKERAMFVSFCNGVFMFFLGAILCLLFVYTFKP